MSMVGGEPMLVLLARGGSPRGPGGRRRHGSGTHVPPLRHGQEILGLVFPHLVDALRPWTALN